MILPAVHPKRYTIAREMTINSTAFWHIALAAQRLVGRIALEKTLPMVVLI